MKRAFLAALSAVAVASFLSSQRNRKTSWGSGSSEQDIRDAIRKIGEAQLNADASVLDRCFADDYTFTNPFGEVMTKEQVLSDLRTGTIKFSGWDVDDIRLRIYGDSAVSTAHVNLKAQRYGHDISGEYRGTWFWIKNRGRWQPVAGQSTRVGQPGMLGSAQTTAGAKSAVTRS